MKKQVNLRVNLNTIDSIKRGEKEKMRLENEGYELKDTDATLTHAYFMYVKGD